MPNPLPPRLRNPAAVLAAAALLTLPGCVFAVGTGGGSRPHAPAERYTQTELAQIELAEAYANQPFPDDQREGLVRLAGTPGLTDAARRRVVRLAQGLAFPSDRRAVLDAVAEGSTPGVPPTPAGPPTPPL